MTVQQAGKHLQNMPRLALGVLALLASATWGQPEDKPSVGYAYQVLFEGGQQTAVTLEVSTFVVGEEAGVASRGDASSRMLGAVGWVAIDGKRAILLCLCMLFQTRP